MDRLLKLFAVGTGVVVAAAAVASLILFPVVITDLTTAAISEGVYALSLS